MNHRGFPTCGIPSTQEHLHTQTHFILFPDGSVPWRKMSLVIANVLVGGGELISLTHAFQTAAELRFF